uniref:Uncharacterized protein n=1 Tax=Anguilla anguilla TaxID=7936 RepID=A0A0E9R445_ANGAN
MSLRWSEFIASQQRVTQVCCFTVCL